MAVEESLAKGLEGELDDYDIQKAVKGSEIVTVTRVQRKPSRKRGGGNEEINGASAPCLAASADHCRNDPSVGSSSCTVEGKGIERRLSAL